MLISGLIFVGFVFCSFVSIALSGFFGECGDCVLLGSKCFWDPHMCTWEVTGKLSVYVWKADT